MKKTAADILRDSERRETVLACMVREGLSKEGLSEGVEGEESTIHSWERTFLADRMACTKALG